MVLQQRHRAKGTVGSLRVKDLVLDLRDGRRIVVPSLNPRPFLPQFRKRLGDNLGMDQELKQTLPLTRSDSGLIVAKGNGVKMTPSLSLVLHHREGSRVSEPLNVLPLAVIEEPFVPGVEASDWVVQTIKSFHHVVGVSCEGFKGDMMTLLKAIEASRTQNGTASSSNPLSRSVNRRQQELKRLDCSMNYDSKGDQCSRGKGKGKGSKFSL